MANFDEIINDIIREEVGGKPNGGYTNDPVDGGGRTQYGIAEASNPEAWLDGKVTEQEAREIYLRKYVIWPKFHQIPPKYRDVQKQLIDYGVHSGHFIAIQKLQTVIGAKADGVIGPKTLAALEAQDPRAVNNALVCERVKMIGNVCKKNPSQLRFINGWLDRALGFLV